MMQMMALDDGDGNSMMAYIVNPLIDYGLILWHWMMQQNLNKWADRTNALIAYC